LFGEYPGTLINFMWQASLHGVASFVTECLKHVGSAGKC